VAVIVIGACMHCQAVVKADDKRDAATLPILQRAQKLGKLTCKTCAAANLTAIDRDNPPDLSTRHA
jgi:hypothetical protein